MTQVEVFTAGGIASGRLVQPGGLHDALESEAPLDLEGVTWYPLAGGAAEARRVMDLESDEVLVIACDEQDLPIHATWHAVELGLGPYRVTGELPTQPGFDPGRALARPGGAFLLLRDVQVEIAGRPEGGRVDRGHASVNRYAVDQVAADIDLGFFFPGARFLSSAGVPLG